MGKILLLEFTDDDKREFEEIIAYLKRFPHFEKMSFSNENIISFPGLEISPEQRTVYCNCKKVHLTTKEFDILCLLATNKGQVLTYEQIYQYVWGGFPSGEVNDTIGFHVRNLRKNSAKCHLFLCSVPEKWDTALKFNQNNDSLGKTRLIFCLNLRYSSSKSR